ncbi:hypothetical protein [Streptomyces tubercidicus]|uniref:hypothetical protein n=1 Tax=Streptomyces tubercidicus TaxID=47759 RepID=UPI0013598EEC|nr:hypothetical protein [Streptomyces tubercidicus]WAU12913.1 hypothetical protein STRTU_003329 [Streptomyces tubercidicus]
MEETGKVSGWLGVAAAVVGLLAFFGITNVDELQRKLNPDSTNAAACKRADQAYKSYQEVTIYSSKAGAARAYAEELRHVVSATDNEELQAAFRANITSSELYAQARDSEAPYLDRVKLGVKIITDRGAWRSLCGELEKESG